MRRSKRPTLPPRSRAPSGARGRRGNLIKIIWHDGQGACLFTKRLERGRFLWPSLADGVVTVSVAQLSYLLSGIDWRMPRETWRPQATG
jgi:transposase